MLERMKLMLLNPGKRSERMDRANTSAVENENTTRQSGEANDIYVEDEGEKYRVPYDKVKRIVFSNLNKSELIDLEHAARIQYRLLLNEAILQAKVSFVKQEITIIYNPTGSHSRNPSISREEIVNLLEKEGVHINQASVEETDVDYYKEIWYPQFHPKQIREHAPYGFTIEEWKKMKNEYEKKVAKARASKWASFLSWQKKYESEHPELAEKQQ